METTYWRAGVVTYRETEYGPNEGSIPEGRAGTRRGDVTDLSRKSGKRFAILTGRWLAGEPELVLVATLTLGPQWEGFDFRGSIGRLVEWLRRHEIRGIALIGTQQRGAPYLHLYLAAGDCGGDRIQDYWLARSTPTGALPQGQDCKVMTSEAAAINYAVRHHSMRSRQSGSYRGRRWRVIDPVGIEAHSASPEPLEGEPPIRAAYMRAALQAQPFNTRMFVQALAGTCKDYFVGPLPTAPVPYLWMTGPKAYSRGWHCPPRRPVDPEDGTAQAIWEYRMDRWEEMADVLADDSTVRIRWRDGKAVAVWSTMPVNWDRDWITVGGCRFPDHDEGWEAQMTRQATAVLTRAAGSTLTGRLEMPLDAPLAAPPRAPATAGRGAP